MKLSEALRLGEFALPPVHGAFRELDNNGDICGACAVTRACVAAGFTFSPGLANCASRELMAMSKFMNEAWPWTKDQPIRVLYSEVENPSRFMGKWGIEQYNNVALDMSNLYEANRWPLTQIAAWIEKFEPHDEPQACASETVHVTETVSEAAQSCQR